MFEHNKSDNVVAIEIPNQIAHNKIDGPAVNHVESAVREGLGLRRGEELADCIGTVVTGIKREATTLITELALTDSEYTAEEFIDALQNDNWDFVNTLKDEEFIFNVVVDVPPVNHYSTELEESEETFDNEGELKSQAWKDAVKMRNRNIFDPDRTNDYLKKNDCEVIDQLVVVSDGQKSSRALADDAMFHGTDVSTVAFNALVESPPSEDRQYSG